jgi:cytochrome b
MKSGTLVFFALLLSLLIIGSVGVSAQEDTFLGMTAEELFPGAIDETERDTAMAALLEANLPDARDRFAGQTLTVAVLLASGV